MCVRKKITIMIAMLVAMIVLAVSASKLTSVANIEGNICHIKLYDSGADIDNGAMAYADGTTVVIGKSGTYKVVGTCANGRIVVDTADTQDIKLLLDSVTISCATSSPLCINNSGDVYVELVGKSRLSDGNIYESQIEGKPNACIFSKKDIHFDGTGSLEVVANYHHGISVRGDLSIMGGNIMVSAPCNAIDAKKLVSISGGNIALVAYGDGINVKNNDIEGEGDILINGGHLDITAQDEGINAAGNATIDGGNHVITAAGEMIRVGNKADISSKCITVR